MAAISLRAAAYPQARSPGSIFRRVSTLMLILSPTRRWRVLRGCRNRENFTHSKRRRVRRYRAACRRGCGCRAGHPGDHKHAAPSRAGEACGYLGIYLCEYAQSWEEVGVEVTIAEDFAALESMDVAIIVNPNNPDGRRVPAGGPPRAGAALAARGCLLIADELSPIFWNPAPAPFRRCPPAVCLCCAPSARPMACGAPARICHRAKNLS